MKQLLICFIFTISSVASAESAVILLYHHVDQQTPASTSITPQLFAAQMRYLQQQQYQVWPLAKIAEFVASKKAFPEKVVGISFDDAYQSVFRQAWPILRQHKFPFTVFAATSYLGDQAGLYMSWAQTKQLLASDLVTLGHHSHAHEHLIFRRQNETAEQWRQRVRDDLRTANKIFKTQLGRVPSLYAHPYGEYSPELNEVVKDLGMFGFGQQSGPAGQYSDPQAIARFPMTNAFGQLKDFSAKVAMQQLPVVDYKPKSPLLAGKGRPFTFDMVLAPSPAIKNLKCYDAAGRNIQVKQHNARYAIAANGFQSTGRHKYNCTAQHSGQTLWYSFLWVVPD